MGICNAKKSTAMKKSNLIASDSVTQHPRAKEFQQMEEEFKDLAEWEGRLA
jgi:hypothetical protein